MECTANRLEEFSFLKLLNYLDIVNGRTRIREGSGDFVPSFKTARLVPCARAQPCRIASTAKNAVSFFLATKAWMPSRPWALRTAGILAVSVPLCLRQTHGAQVEDSDHRRKRQGLDAAVRAEQLRRATYSGRPKENQVRAPASRCGSLPLQHQSAFGLDRWRKPFDDLAEQPGQRDLQMHVIVRHVDRAVGCLPHCAYAE